MGKHIFLWHDRWHRDGALYLKYFYRVIYDAASRLDAEVNSVLNNKNWI